MAPQPFPRRFQGRIRSMTPAICNHGETRLKPATPPSPKSSPNASLVPRGATTFHISPMVTDLVTVNGNSRAANAKRRHGPTLRSGWKLHHDARKQKPSTCNNNPRETTQEQQDTTNPSSSSTTSHSLPNCPQEPLQRWEDFRRRFQTIFHHDHCRFVDSRHTCYKFFRSWSQSPRLQRPRSLKR